MAQAMAKIPSSKAVRHVSIQVSAHAVFDVRSVTVTPPQKIKKKLQRLTDNKPVEESIKASGILPGTNFHCNQFGLPDDRSRFSDSSPIQLAPDRYPSVQQLKRDTYPEEINKVYFSGSEPEYDYALFCSDRFDKQALLHKEYRLVLDSEVIQEKLIREAAAAKDQQQDMERKKESDSAKKQFQYVIDKFFNNEPQPSLTEQAQPNSLPSRCTAGTATLLGGKRNQEDVSLYKQMSMQSPEDSELFGVLDGHASARCAMNIASHLPQNIENRFKTYSRFMKPEVALWNAGKIGCVDASMQAKNDGAGYESGTTFCGVLIQQETLTFINSGDSRGIIVNNNGEVIQMTEDAKPGDERYKKSIEKRQGVVIKDPKREIYRVGANYASARGLGDGMMAGISARPKLTECAKETTNMIILASDGVWDVATSQQIGELAQALYDEGKSPIQIADIISQLVLHTYQNIARLGRYDLSRVGDNITVTVIFPNQRSAGRI